MSVSATFKIQRSIAMNHRIIRQAVQTTTASIFEQLEDRKLFAAYVVTSLADNGPNTLREAIDMSNQSVGVHDTINFDVTAAPGDPDGVPDILLTAKLPVVTD